MISQSYPLNLTFSPEERKKLVEKLGSSKMKDLVSILEEQLTSLLKYKSLRLFINGKFKSFQIYTPRKI